MNLRANSRRLWHILTVLVRHLPAYLLGEHLTPYPRLARWLADETVARPERLRMIFEELGGTFIKFGQVLALQPDILPLIYCNALFKLLDRIAPFEFEAVQRTFQEQFGKQPEDIYDDFDSEPIATASIGQVYRARLGDRELAVKVQRPNVESDFAGDVRLMTGTIYLIQTLRLKRLYWMVEPLSEFVSWTREELNYTFEARYAERLRRNIQDSTKEYIPAIEWEYTTHCVLTIEYLEGITLINYIRALETNDELQIRRLQAQGFDPNVFARNIVDNFLGDAFVNGMFHADLHPANLMILPNNVVGYIDFGITGVISRYLRHHLVALTLAYSRGDLDGMYNAFFKVSALAADADLTAFRRGLDEMSSNWYTMQGDERQLLKNITLVMLDMLKLSRQTGVWPERDVIKYIRSSVAIDGLVTRFAPSFDVGKYLETVCNQYLKWYAREQLLTVETFTNWSSANGNLLQDGVLRASHLLDLIESKEWPASGVSGSPHETDDGIRQRAVQLGALAFFVVVLMFLTKAQVQFGVNLFTAELLLIAAALISLLRVIWRLI